MKILLLTIKIVAVMIIDLQILDGQLEVNKQIININRRNTKVVQFKELILILEKLNMNFQV